MRKLTKGMFKNGDDVCANVGGTTIEEAKVFINESDDPELNIDKQLQAISHEYRLILEKKVRN